VVKLRESLSGKLAVGQGTATVVCAYYLVTEEERHLLETTARSLLTLKEEILDRVAGIEAVQLALFLSNGRTDIALARLKVQADLLRLKGTPSAYLTSFLARVLKD
jgi:hypothetical protein